MSKAVFLNKNSLKLHSDYFMIYCKTIPSGLFIIIIPLLAKIKRKKTESLTRTLFLQFGSSL